MHFPIKVFLCLNHKRGFLSYEYYHLLLVKLGRFLRTIIFATKVKGIRKKLKLNRRCFSLIWVFKLFEYFKVYPGKWHWHSFDQLFENFVVVVGFKIYFLGMAAMPFPCNGILLIQCNLPRVIQVVFQMYRNIVCVQ